MVAPSGLLLAPGLSGSFFLSVGALNLSLGSNGPVVIGGSVWIPASPCFLFFSNSV
jgi:hypothetical protein